MDQVHHALKDEPVTNLTFCAEGCGKLDLVHLFEAHESASLGSQLFDHVRSSGAVGHAVYPCAKRASPVEGLEALPQGDVDLLQQIARFVRIGFVDFHQALKRRSKVARGLDIQLVPAHTLDSQRVTQNITHFSNQSKMVLQCP